MEYYTIIDTLKGKGVPFETGLTGQEVAEIEILYGICFPPDLKEFLQTALPISEGFVNWRDESDANIASIKDRLNWPLEGILFDIEVNSFWFREWGKKPEKLSDAFDICRDAVRKAPTLIPIFSHRYIPSKPQEADNPVYSVHQTDIVYYGENLLSYLDIEFGSRKHYDYDLIKKDIRFWSKIAG